MKKQPQRMCVSCKERHDKKDLLRVVLGDDGNIVFDPTGKHPGRGAYLCKKESCIMLEIKAHRISRGLKGGSSDDELRKLAQDIISQDQTNA